MTHVQVMPEAQFGTYQSSVTILGFYLPSAIVICLLIGELYSTTITPLLFVHLPS